MHFVQRLVRGWWTAENQCPLNIEEKQCLLNKVSDHKSSHLSLPWFQKRTSTDSDEYTTPSSARHEFEALSPNSVSNVYVFTFKELKTITKKFRVDNVLGKGKFGRVYKGSIDDDMKPGLKAQPVAVKVLDPNGRQGHKEWLAEINFLGQFSHPHLVKLIGYCCEDEHRLLVYEFMPRGSLENHLFTITEMSVPLSWSTRKKIALGVAKGLAFVHGAEKSVIYRDFKTSTILLDNDYMPKLSHSRLSKGGPEGDQIHTSPRFLSTFDYVAPDYVMNGSFSYIYTFGVVLLELLTGRRSRDKTRPSGEYNLAEWARPLIEDKSNLLQILDPRLEGVYCVKEVHKAANLAYHCISKNPKARPLMKDVVEILEPLQSHE